MVPAKRGLHMDVLRRTLVFLGIQPSPNMNGRVDYRILMEEALERMRMAETQLREAASSEELDTARSALLAARAEVQHLIRSAKRERGVALRPVSENEEIHRMLRTQLHQRSKPQYGTVRRRINTGT